MSNRERSRSYPGVNLAETVENTKKIRKQLGSGKLVRDSLTVGLGYQKYFGDIGVKISSMVQFGMLDKDKDGYALSKLSEKITHFKDQAEYDAAILQAFYKPGLYQEVIEKYKNDGSVPAQLANILYRDHGITNNSSTAAARTFIESANFANIIDNENRFIDKVYESEDESASVYVVDEKFDQKPNQYIDMVPYRKEESEPITQIQTIGETVNVGRQTFNFALSAGKFAQLVVPTGLRPKDILIIRKQIELLELQTEEE